jgi:type I restriction enzyme M protein
LDGKTDFYENEGEAIILSAIGARCGKCFLATGKWTAIKNTIVIQNRENILLKYLFEYINNEEYWLKSGTAQPFITVGNANEQKIPLPPKDIQEKIVSEIEFLEKQEQKAIEEVEKLKGGIFDFYKNTSGCKKRLDEICELKAGQFVKADNIYNEYIEKRYPCYGGNGLRGYTVTFTNEGQFSLVGRQGALCGNVHLVSGKFHATEHALVAYPKDNVNTIWLHYQLVFMNLNQFATGTAQPGLSVMNLNPIEITFPTLNDQTKIVAEIEKIVKKISDLEKQIELIPKQKEKVLKKYL